MLPSTLPSSDILFVLKASPEVLVHQLMKVFIFSTERLPRELCETVFKNYHWTTMLLEIKPQIEDQSSETRATEM